jgi:hypothetical protein
MTSQDIIDSVTKRICESWLAISIDGSSFDASQYAILQKIVENEFFRRLEPQILEWCIFQTQGLKNVRDPADIAKAMMKSLLSTTNVMYITLPGINDEPWTDEQLAHYRRETSDRVSNPWDNVLRIEIEGTTFSGLSTRTTLGNTLRSVAYMFYYAALAGIDDPWNSK